MEICELLQFVQTTQKSVLTRIIFYFQTEWRSVSGATPVFGESNKTPGYAGGIRELQLQAKTSYAIIILSPPRHKKA